jgi:hypothetical protein
MHTYMHTYIQTYIPQQAGNSPEEDEFATPNNEFATPNNEFATPNQFVTPKEFDDASVTAKAASEPFWQQQQRLQGQQVGTSHTIVAQGP